jgi:hypothetical protein
MVIKFHMKKVVCIRWTNQKGLTQNKKKSYAQFQTINLPTYLSTCLGRYIVWSTHLDQPMYLLTYVPIHMKRYLT